MDGEVKAAVQQPVLDLLGEQPLHADPAQGSILHPVAGRADDGNLDRAGCRQSRMRSGQTPARLLGLGEGERAAARADANNGRHARDFEKAPPWAQLVAISWREPR